MNARLILSAGAAMILAACATPAPAPPPSAARPAPTPAPAAPPPSTGMAAFSTSDFAWSTAKGTGGIDGLLNYKASGVTYGCVDAGVVLTPETPWVRRRMEILYRSADKATLPADEVRARTPPERSQDYSAFVKRATCDATGKFTFAGLPNGAWYVITVARPTGGAKGVDMAIMRRVTIAGGRVTKVAL